MLQPAGAAWIADLAMLPSYWVVFVTLPKVCRLDNGVDQRPSCNTALVILQVHLVILESAWPMGEDYGASTWY
jgi:hypothetical protein